MRRDPAALSDREYDVVVVGGGIFGICSAWDAALRGLSVALVERGDFAHATSANSFKIVHGGVRYLQHADLPRIRESSRERSALLRIAPHLVQPLPIAIPTYGHGARGKELLWAGLRLYDLLTFDRNRRIRDPARRIPRSRFISRGEALELFPGLAARDLTGAAIFSDAQMYNPQRLALSFLRSAVERGAQAANYVEATAFLRSADRVTGVKARDVLSGRKLEIRGRLVLNAAGPWAERLLSEGGGLRLDPPGTYSRDACFVVPRRLAGEVALAVQGRTRDPDAILSRQARHLFIVPWREYTLIGVWHVVHGGGPDSFAVTEHELRGFLDEINEAYPPLGLTLAEVSTWNAGLVLFGENLPGQTDLSTGKRSRLVDHAQEHGVQGLLSLIGVRYTTARGEAARAIDRALDQLGLPLAESTTADTPIHGGGIESFDDFLRSATQRHAGLLDSGALDGAALRSLLRNHGSAYREVLRLVEEDPSRGRRLGSSHVIRAEVVHAAREEMAQKLADVVFRRTELGTGGHPGEAPLRECARVMAGELGWSPERERVELEETRGAFPLPPPARAGDAPAS